MLGIRRFVLGQQPPCGDGRRRRPCLCVFFSITPNTNASFLLDLRFDMANPPHHGVTHWWTRAAQDDYELGIRTSSGQIFYDVDLSWFHLSGLPLAFLLPDHSDGA